MVPALLSVPVILFAGLFYISVHLPEYRHLCQMSCFLYRRKKRDKQKTVQNNTGKQMAFIHGKVDFVVVNSKPMLKLTTQCNKS